MCIKHSVTGPQAIYRTISYAISHVVVISESSPEAYASSSSTEELKWASIAFKINFFVYNTY